MATGGVSMRTSSSRNTAYGSVKSMRSLGGVSIFQDPEAGTTLPRDEEMTFMMYENVNDEGKLGPARSVSQVVSQRSSGYMNSGDNEDSVINGDFNAPEKDRGSYTFTFSHAETGVRDEKPEPEVSGGGQSNGGVSSIERAKSNERLNKSGKGLFQMKSAFGVTQLSRASSVSSNSTLKDDAFKSSLDDTLTRKMKKDKDSMDQTNTYFDKSSTEGKGPSNGEHQAYPRENGATSTGQANGYTLEGDLKESFQSSSSKTASNGYLHQGQSADLELSATSSSKPPLSKRDSDLTSVSSLTSYSFGDSLTRKLEQKHVSGSKTTDSPGAMTPTQAISRSNSQPSFTKSISKSPSLSSIYEKNRMTVTEVYDDTQRDKGDFQFKSSQSDNVGSLDRQSSSVSSESSKTSTVRMAVSKDTIDSTSSASTNERSSAPRFSSQSSIVQNKEFRDKMSSLFSSSGASKHRSDSPSLNSSASSTLARGHGNTYSNEMHLEITSHSSQQSDKVVTGVSSNSDVHSATFPRAGHGDNRPISPDPLSPVHEMQSTIKTGTVGSLVKDKFKNLNLTGRSLERSAADKPKTPSAEGSGSTEISGSSAGQKPYKFLIEGIDFPEREIQEAERKEDTTGGREQDGASSDSGESSLSAKKKREMSKKGFSYVLDKQLASAIIKKAEDVTSRRPHEALEIKTAEEPQKEMEESEVLVKAKSKLKHEDSFSGRSTDYRSKQALPTSLLKDIRTRLVPVQNNNTSDDEGQNDKEDQRTVDTKVHVKQSEMESTEETKEIISPTQVEVKDGSSGGLDVSLLSSVSTFSSSQNVDGTETTMTSSQNVDRTDMSSQEDLLPVSDKQLIYDGFNYELRHSGLLEGDATPKSYSQVFKAQTKTEHSPYKQTYTSKDMKDSEFKREESVLVMNRSSSPGERVTSREGAVDAQSMQNMQETIIIQRDDVTGVNSLRQHTKQGGGYSTASNNNTSSGEISLHQQKPSSHHAMESDTDSSTSTPLLRSRNSPVSEPVPTPRTIIQHSVQSSDSEDSEIDDYMSRAKRNDGIPTIPEEEPHKPRGVLSTRVPVVEKTHTTYTHHRIAHDPNNSFGTEVKETPLTKNNNRAASGQERHNDLPDVYTKETHDFSGVTSVRKSPRRGQGDRLRGDQRGGGSELYIEVTGGNRDSRKEGRETLHISTTDKHHAQDLFYSDQPPQHLVSNTAPVHTERIRSPQGQLYTSLHTGNTTRGSVEKSPSGPKSPRGGVLYVRHKNNKNKSSPQREQTSPHYSDTTHTSSRGSEALSPPGFRHDLFYQPSPGVAATQGRVLRPVSRSSSSTAGSVNSFRSEGVYVYRTDKQPKGRTLKELNDLKVVHLKPLRVNSQRDGQKVLKTHPTFYSPHDNTVTSPVYLSDVDQFDTSNMMGTSTLRHNMDPNYLQMGSDENMNYKGGNNSRRFLTVDDISGGRVPMHRGMQVSTINIDNNYNDAHSGHSEPIMPKRNKYQVQRVMDTRRSDKQFSSPMDMHPDMHFKKQKFYSVSRNVEPKSPEIQVELDPHLEEAHKTGDQYNVTMKLNASTLGLPNNNGAKDLFQEEYIEESLYKNNNNTLRSQAPQMHSPGVYSSRSTSEDSAILSPGNRSKTNITLIEDYVAPQQPPTAQSTLEHMRFTQYMGNPPTISSTAAPVTRNDNEPRPRKHQQMPLQQRGVDPNGYPGNNTNNGAPPPTTAQPPKFSMCIDQTMTMDYVPGSENEINNNDSLSPQRVNTVERQYVSEEPIQPRRNVPQKKAVMDDPRIVNGGDVYTTSYNHRSIYPDQDDDLQQYLSPAEEEPIVPTRKKTPESAKGYPQVVRGSILIKNSIDTTGAPKVIDVVEGDTESDDETLINDNVNPFHGHYFQARENPMYSSDPDLRAEREQQRRPGFTQIFEEKVQKSSAGKNYGGNSSSRDYPDNEDFDTEITVTRVNGSTSGSPRKKTKSSQQSTESTSYVYNGYDQTDRGRGGHSSGGGQARGGGGKKALSRSEKREFEISRLLKDAPAESIKQTINVEREEEEILGPLPQGDDGTGPDSLLNFDTISEKVDLGMKDGGAQLAVKVRCERIVPIRGVTDMFKKSSVIVTRLIEIDLLVTEERRRLYEYITETSKKSIPADDGQTRSSSMFGEESKLSTKETFKLYKTFMGMAEADDKGKSRDNIRIDRQVEEKRRPQVQAEADLLDMADHDDLEFDTDDLGRQLEEQLIARAMRAPEPDTISYLSAASESASILY